VGRGETLIPFSGITLSRSRRPSSSTEVLGYDYGRRYLLRTLFRACREAATFGSPAL
jgi:hypothetical protein